MTDHRDPKSPQPPAVPLAIDPAGVVRDEEVNAPPRGDIARIFVDENHTPPRVAVPRDDTDVDIAFPLRGAREEVLPLPPRAPSRLDLRYPAPDWAENPPAILLAPGHTLSTSLRASLLALTVDPAAPVDPDALPKKR